MMVDRRVVLAMIGFRQWFGAWRFQGVSIADDAIDGLSEQAWAEGTARWWRREPGLPATEVIGTVPEWP
jgi:hypothetical protein